MVYHIDANVELYIPHHSDGLDIGQCVTCHITDAVFNVNISLLFENGEDFEKHSSQIEEESLESWLEKRKFVDKIYDILPVKGSKMKVTTTRKQGIGAQDNSDDFTTINGDDKAGSKLADWIDQTSAVIQASTTSDNVEETTKPCPVIEKHANLEILDRFRAFLSQLEQDYCNLKLENKEHPVSADTKFDTISSVVTSSPQPAIATGTEDDPKVRENEDEPPLSTDDDGFGGLGLGVRRLWSEMPEVEKEGLLGQINEQERKVQEAMFEVISTEFSYLAGLDTLVSHFMNDSKLSDDSLLKKEDKKILFSNIQRVRDVSKSICQEMAAMWKTSCLLSPVRLCDILNKFVEEKARVYVTNMRNSVFQGRKLQELKQNPVFAEELKRLEKSPISRSLPLLSYLTLPMQRITRFPILLDAITKHLDPDKNLDEFHMILRCQSKMQALVKQCNEEAKEMESIESIAELDRHLVFKNIKKTPIVSKGRSIVKSGNVASIGEKPTASLRLSKLKKERIHLILLNDLLLITKKKGDSFEVRDFESTADIRIRPDEEASSVMTQKMFAIHFDDKNTEYVLECNSIIERERWIEVLKPSDQNIDLGEDAERDEDDNELDIPMVQAHARFDAYEQDLLGLEINDIVKVLRSCYDEGWNFGERIRDGERGWFPHSYTTVVSDKQVRIQNLRKSRFLLQEMKESFQAHHDEDDTDYDSDADSFTSEEDGTTQEPEAEYSNIEEVRAHTPTPSETSTEVQMDTSKTPESNEQDSSGDRERQILRQLSQQAMVKQKENLADRSVSLYCTSESDSPGEWNPSKLLQRNGEDEELYGNFISQDVQPQNDHRPEIRLGDIGVGARKLWSEMPQVMQEGLHKRLTEQERKVQEAMFEVISTEHTYLKGLDTLVQHFIASPLLSDGRTLDIVAWKVIFSNITHVREVCKSTCHEMADLWSKGCILKPKDLCTILNKFIEEKSSVYVLYMKNSVKQNKKLEHLKKDPTFSKNLESLEKAEGAQHLPLAAYLTLPMQRITRLPLLLNTITNFIDPNEHEEDYNSILTCQRQMQKVVMECNEEVRKMENAVAMAELDKRLIFKKSKKVAIMSEGRTVVKRADLTYLGGKTSTTKRISRIFDRKNEMFHLILLNDLLLITKKKGEDFEVRDCVQLDELKVTCITSGAAGSEATEKMFSIVLSRKAEEYLLECKSVFERERWVSALSTDYCDSGDVTKEEFNFPQFEAHTRFDTDEQDLLGLDVTDVVKVLGTSDSEGWYFGERIRDGQKGWFPSLHTKEVVDEQTKIQNLQKSHFLRFPDNQSNTPVDDQQECDYDSFSESSGTEAAICDSELDSILETSANPEETVQTQVDNEPTECGHEAQERECGHEAQESVCEADEATKHDIEIEPAEMWSDMPTVIELGLLDSLSEKEIRTQEAMYKIISTERTYMAQIDHVCTHFLDSPALLQENVLKKKEKEILFSNIKQIRDSSKGLCGDLDAMLRKSCQIQARDLCEILRQFASEKGQEYITNVGHFVHQERQLTELKKKCLFAKELEKLENQIGSYAVPLMSYLALPTKRIARLPILLEAIANHMDPDEGGDLNTILQCQIQIQRLAKQCVKYAVEVRSLEVLAELEKKLVFKKIKKISIVSEGRVICKRGDLSYIAPNPSTSWRLTKLFDSKKDTLHLLLLNDMLLITKKRGDHFEVRECAARDQIKVKAQNETEALVTEKMFCIHLTEANVEYVMECDSLISRERWVTALMLLSSEDGEQEEHTQGEEDCPQVEVHIRYDADDFQAELLNLDISDVVLVKRKCKNEGWLYGERIRDGEIGWFPSSHTNEIVDEIRKTQNLRRKQLRCEAAANMRTTAQPDQ